MKKNLKQFFAVLLSVVMIAGLIPLIQLPTAFADTWDGTYTDGSGFSNNTITSARGLAYFLNRVANGNTYSGQTVYLATDVNLNNVDLCDAIPYYTTGFEGTFDGQNHTISNFRMTHDNHRVAMFRTAKNATFKNVTVTNVFVDDWAANNKKNGFAVFVGYGDGNLTFENVHISGGYVYGYNYVGGLVGEYGADNILTFTNCSNSALIYADNDRAAGLVGHSKGRVYATNCSNSGEIYAAYSDAGGLAGWVEDDESYFLNCSNTGNVSTDSAAGGMVGYFGSKSNDNKMTITGCVNRGNITSRKSSDGGDAGGMAGKLDTDATHEFANNVNYGQIVATGESAGGMVGANMGGGTWNNCRNYGSIYGKGDNAGGILGEIEDDIQTFYNCLNAGYIESKYTGGGIMGWGSDSKAPSFERCFNYGNVSAGSYGGGILGGHSGGASGNHNDFIECMNAGNVESSDNGGGMVGEGNWTYITRCFNVGNISRKGGGTSKAYGGLIGWDVNDITDSYNVGNVTYGDCAGGVMGGDTHGSYNNCYNAGNCTGGNKNRQIKAQDSSGSFTNCWSCSSVSGETQWSVTDAGGLRDLQNTLNSNAYCKDTWGINNGYPILKWWRDNYFKFPVQLVDGSTNVVNATYNYNASFTAPARSKTGYTFNGWYTASSGGNKVWGPNVTTVYAGVTAPTNTCGMTWSTGDNRPNVLPTANPIKYYAQYTPNPYTIRFNGGGANYGSMDNLSMVYDTAKNLPANGFIRQYTVTYDYNYSGSTNTSDTEVYTFAGWARTENGTKAFNDKQSVNNLTAELNGTVDLYALWNSASVTLPNPTRTGYIFGGWYGEEGCTTKVGDGNTSYTPTGNKTLFAKWTPITYTVSYDGNGSTSGATASSTHTYDVSSALTANGYGRKYTVNYDYQYKDVYNNDVTGSDTATAAFNGWATSASGAKVYDDAQSVLNLRNTAGTYPLYANWTLSTVTLPNPTRDGYQFGGWFTDSDCTQGQQSGGASVTPSANVTYFAKWTPNTYKVHFNGTDATGGEMADQDFTYDVTQALTANGFERKFTVNYEHNGGSGAASGTASAAFTGWAISSAGDWIYEDGETVGNLTATNNDTADLYARWGAMGSVTLPDSPMTGYTFNGWYSDEQLSNRVGGAGDSYTPAANGVTLYAKHTINTYTITFKGENGTVLDEQTVNYNVTPTAPAIPEKGPSSTQHFTGAWNTTVVPATADATYTVVYTGADHSGGEATCVEKAVCDVCGKAYGDLGGHSLTEVPAQAPGCLVPGHVAYWHCDVCGKDFTDETASEVISVFQNAHSYGELIAEVPAKCEEPGTVAHYHCSVCGTDFDTDKNVITDLVIPASGHSYGELIAEVPAKCEESGTVAHYHCEACGKDFDADKNVITDLVIPASGHTYGDLIAEVPAKCEESGTVAHYHCDVCGKDFDADKNVITDLVIPASGHTYGELIAEVPAKCEEPGTVAHYHCSVCGTDFDTDKNVITDLVIPASGHTYGELIAEVSAKCEEAGTVAHYHCSACGKDFDADKNVIIDLVIPASGHSYGELIAEVPAKCEEAGTVAHYHCDACGKDFDADKNVITDLVIPASGHTYGELIAEVPAKCEESGTVAHYHCSACGKDFDADKNVITDLVIPASGHTYGELIAEIPAKCEESGTVAHYHCEACGKDFDADKNVITDLVIPAAGHTYGELIAVVPAKCEEAGTVAHYHCDACGKDFDADKNVITDLVIPASGHTYGDLIAEVPAKCEEAGTVAHYHCDACGKDFDADKNVITDLVIPASGHAYGDLIAEVPAKCEESGTVAHYHCDACSKDFDADKNVITDLVIPVSGHTYGELIAEVPAKCEEAGTVAHYHCSACGKDFDADKNVITELTIPASGHAYGNWTKISDTQHQRVCGNDPTHVETAVHTWNGGEELDDATCMEPGHKLFTCTVCGATKEEDTAYGAHHITVHVIAKAPTCSEDGNPEYWRCETCGKYFTDENGAGEPLDAAPVLHDANAHSYGELIAEVPAKCEEAGTVAHYHCDACGKDFDADKNVITDLVIPAAGHTYGDLIAEVPAKCEESGTVAHYHCAACGKDFDVDKNVITDLVIPASGHTYGELIAEVSTKCEEAGTVAHYHCTACGKDFDTDKNVITDLVIPASGHSYGELIAEVPAKCEESGTVAHYHCEACGKDFDADKNVITDLVIPASGHSYGELIAEVPAKCEESGTVAHYHCEACGKDFDADKNVITDLVIPASGHTYGELLTEIPAKCEEAGTVAHYHCDACGKDFDADKNVITDLVIPASGHTSGSPVKENETPATCTEAGSYELVTYCAVCEAEISRESFTIPAGHTAGDPAIENEIAPTCTEDGSHEVAVYCTECGEEISRTTVTDPAKGHTWGDWEIVTPATEDEDGLAKHVCAVCGEEETKPLSALGEEVTKTIRFINIAKMHYVLDLGDGETYTIYNSSVVQWISKVPLKFTVYTYSGYQFEDIIIRANGVVIEPDEDGYYSLPQTAETVIVSAEGAVKDDIAPGGKLSFWELLIRFFRSIVAFFSASFGKS